MASRWRCAAPAWREGLQGARQPTQRFSGTASVCWAAPAPTRSALRALDECAELLRPAGGCCAAVRPRRFGTRMARSASAPRSGARRIFGPHRALGEPTSPRRMTPKSSTGKTKVVENLEKMLMVQVRQRAPHCTPLYPLPSCRGHSPLPHDCPLRSPCRCPGQGYPYRTLSDRAGYLPPAALPQTRGPHESPRPAPRRYRGKGLSRTASTARPG